MKLVNQTDEEELLGKAQMEIVKAAAQAWHGHTNKSLSSVKEIEPCTRKFKGRPSRFKSEWLRDGLAKNGRGEGVSGCWDFRQSLLDSYEVVTVSKRLEDAGMVLEHSFSKPYGCSSSGQGVNTLRFLFDHMSSRRFAEPK